MENTISSWRVCSIPSHEDDDYMDMLEKELDSFMVGDDSYPATTLISESLSLIKALRYKIRTLETYIKKLPNEQE